METHRNDALKKFLIEQYEALPAAEREFIHRVLQRKHNARNTNQDFDAQLTLGQRVADKVAAFGGSWTFILSFMAILFSWIVLNTFVLAKAQGGPFDPYPYILLNLVLSMLAALQAPVIMMSQNRQAAKDRLDAAHDYEVNIKAEIEIARLHEKMDELREKQWADLVAMQQEQISLLTKLLASGKQN